MTITKKTSKGELNVNKLLNVISTRRPLSGDANAYLACMGAALLLVGLSVSDALKHTKREAQATSALIVHNVVPSDLLLGRNDLRGSPTAAYTLVEFGDYECSPCRRNQLLVTELLKHSGSNVKLDFRQMPLTQIHPYAQEAAIAAESARAAGKFWLIHDQLFSADLTQQGAVTNVMKSAGVLLSTKSAEKQVALDGQLAKRIGVTGTPTFVLLTPGGVVYKLSRLDEAEKLIR